MLSYYKTIDINKESIFYSLINHNNIIFCFRRKYWDYKRRIIDKLIIDSSFNIINISKDQYRGEDPRSFIHNNKLYVVDNYYNDNHLIDVNQNLYLKLKIDGKNLTFISHENKLYFIYRMKPFILYEVLLKNGNVIKIVHDYGENNNEYRGGTPGYLKSENIYFGFGHRTYCLNNQVIHDIFYWEIDFNDKPKITIKDVNKPKNAGKICDPTSIIEINNIKYLITAETDYPWNKEQNYITNTYKIESDEFVKDLQKVESIN